MPTKIGSITKQMASGRNANSVWTALAVTETTDTQTGVPQTFEPQPEQQWIFTLLVPDMEKFGTAPSEVRSNSIAGDAFEESTARTNKPRKGRRCYDTTGLLPRRPFLSHSRITEQKVESCSQTNGEHPSAFVARVLQKLIDEGVLHPKTPDNAYIGRWDQNGICQPCKFEKRLVDNSQMDTEHST